MLRISVCCALRRRIRCSVCCAFCSSGSCYPIPHFLSSWPWRDVGLTSRLMMKMLVSSLLAFGRNPCSMLALSQLQFQARCSNVVDLCIVSAMPSVRQEARACCSEHNEVCVHSYMLFFGATSYMSFRRSLPCPSSRIPSWTWRPRSEQTFLACPSGIATGASTHCGAHTWNTGLRPDLFLKPGPLCQGWPCDQLSSCLLVRFHLMGGPCSLAQILTNRVLCRFCLPGAERRFVRG